MTLSRRTGQTSGQELTTGRASDPLHHEQSALPPELRRRSPGGTASAAWARTPAAEDGVPGLKRLAPELRDLRRQAAELGQQTTAIEDSREGYLRTRGSGTPRRPAGLRSPRSAGPFTPCTLQRRSSVTTSPRPPGSESRRPHGPSVGLWAKAFSNRRFPTTLTARVRDRNRRAAAHQRVPRFTNQQARRNPIRGGPGRLIGHPGIASTAAGRGPGLLARCRAYADTDSGRASEESATRRMLASSVNSTIGIVLKSA
jgi:hypothetical protein